MLVQNLHIVISTIDKRNMNPMITVMSYRYLILWLLLGMGFGCSQQHSELDGSGKYWRKRQAEINAWLLRPDRSCHYAPSLTRQRPLVPMDPTTPLLRYTQDSIASYMNDIDGQKILLKDQIDNLLQSPELAKNFPPIRVFDFPDPNTQEPILWTLDNRRLYVMREAQKRFADLDTSESKRLDIVVTFASRDEVENEFYKMKTFPQIMGRSIRVRAQPTGPLNLLDGFRARANRESAEVSWLSGLLMGQ